MLNAFAMGTAFASLRFNGAMPRICSMVANMLTVLYRAESTKLCFTYGPTIKAVLRCAST